jgi:LacI family repressor for deo operon, udp, cdd, tsx, nupC, and nupG
MPTIKELAQAIGVSPTTVSRVMHGRGRISAATRQRVLQQIQEAGYTPNVNAQRLVAGRTQMVALDFGDWSDALANMFFVELTRGVQDALDARHYGLLLNTRRDTLRRWVLSRAVDGVILAMGDPRHNPMLRDVTGRGIPCVVIGHHAVEGLSGVGSVVVGLRHGARQVARMLTDWGHRRIGFLGNNDPQDVVLLEFKAELDRLGVDLRAERVLTGSITPEEGERAALALLSQPDPPTALFARSDALAAGALRTARKMALRVPEQLSLVGHDDVPFAELAEPPLTTVRVNCLELGRLATETLLSLLSYSDYAVRAHTVQTELVIRETVAGAPADRNDLTRFDRAPK